MANNCWTLPSRIDIMVTLFQIAQYEFHWAMREARDNAISANSQGHLTFLSKEQVSSNPQRLLKYILYEKE